VGKQNRGRYLALQYDCGQPNLEELTKEQIKVLNYLVRSILTIETTNGTWCPSCPVYKQSHPISSLIKEMLGGDILHCPTKRGETHYWNLLSNGEEIDLTYEEIKFGEDSLLYEEIDILEEEDMGFKSIHEARRYSLLTKKAEYLIRDYGVETLGEVLNLYQC